MDSNKLKKLSLIFCLILALLCSACAGSNPSVDPACIHQDANDDGVCEVCCQSVLVTVDLYGINDLHGKLEDGDSHIGVDELTTYLRKAQATQNTVLISAGDMWQGSAESNQTHGLIMTDWMNDLGFAAMTMGNHEYDWGSDAIADNVEAAEFPMLAINIYDRTTNTRVEYYQPSVVVDVKGVQIGIIGAIGDCYSSIATDKTEDVYFKTGSALTELVKAESLRLRQEEGVDFVVYSIHDGYGSTTSSLSDRDLAGYYDISLSDGYVDLVFEGHTHQKYAAQDSHGVWHLQHRGDNSGGISHVQVRINPVTGSYTVRTAELISSSTYASLADDPIVESLLNKYEDQIAPAKQVLGNNRSYRNSSFLCQLAADLYYELGVSTWGDQYDIALGGGFLAARSPYNLPAGEVRYGDLQSLFPFDNDIVLCSIRGSDLLSKFINTSNSKYYISNTYGTIDPNATYYVVVDTYTADYSYNNLTIVETYTPGIYTRDLLADYVAAGGLA